MDGHPAKYYKNRSKSSSGSCSKGHVTNFHLREREHMMEVAVGTGSVAMYVASSHEEQEEP